MRARRPLRLASVGAAACAAALAMGASAGTTGAPAVSAFPSSQTVPGSGALPTGGRQAIDLNAARGESEGAWLVTRGGRPFSVSVDSDQLEPLTVELAWGHFVSVDGRLVADALLPWDGSERAPEQPNQPVYIRALVPPDAAPGLYTGSVTVTGAGPDVTLPLRVRVFPHLLPARGDGSAWLSTSFHVSATTYVNTVARLYGFGSHAERRAAHTSLYRFLAEYRVSPSSWGFGEPRSTAGYTTDKRWWWDAATNMKEAAESGFASMRIPISSNRTAPRNWIAGLDPSRPESWCSYLQSVQAFWKQNGWTDRSMPFLYAQDEPKLEGMRLVAKQSQALHQCWPAAKSAMTGNPDQENGFLSDGKGGDDLDIWVILTSRFYGRFTAPAAPRDRSRELFSRIDRIRPQVTLWSYTYGTKGTPGLRATEPLSSPRMLVLWNALEGLRGLLYGQGTTSYRAAGNPLDSLSDDGEFVLLYPAKGGPVPSARLEQLRDGIEDWALLEAVRRRGGAGAVRQILGGAGLFSTDRSGTRLGCVVGCQMKSATKFSWPVWSSDLQTATRIESARLAALQRLR